MTKRPSADPHRSSKAYLILGSMLLLAPVTRPAIAEAPAAAPSTSHEARIEELLQKMTLDEKLGQLTQQTGGASQEYNPGVKDSRHEELIAVIREGKVGSILNAHGAEYTNSLQRVAVEESRLRIPLILANDVIHGYRTIFPIPLGEAASWDLELIEKAARVAAEEAAASGTHWTFAPMVDICRDPRWGRIAEGAGEDPFLGSAIAAARVRGFQGKDLAAPDTVLACAKHFAAYGAAEGGRDYNTVDVSEQVLREVYLPPFHAAVEAGVGSLMSSFNEISGIPATANELTLKRILRQEWGFDGTVVSDWSSITEMVAHGFAADAADAAEKAILAGVDMDMSSFSYRSHLDASVGEGSISERTVDQAVRRILRMKTDLGLFDRPYVEPAREQSVILSDANRNIARDMARHSIVLLKNEGQVLPLTERVGSLAVIGPLADNREDPIGTWAPRGQAEDVITVLQGIKKRAPEGMAVSYAKGCDIEGGRTDGFAEAVEIGKQSDVVILVLGEGKEMSGEAHCRASLDLPGVQEELLRAVHATGVPVVVVLMSGRPLSITWGAENLPAILQTWHLGVECGHAVADVLFGDFNPGGKLPVTFPRSVGQVPIYYAHKSTGRPPSEERYTSKYIDLPSEPLFPFGYGLSYTQFEFSNLTVSPDRIGPYGRVEVSVDVKNVGDLAGDEVVQLYVRDLVASMTRPVKELKGFRRVTLEPGEKTTVRFTLSREHLGFYDRRMDYVVEPGAFTIWVGPSSAEGIASGFEVVSKKE